ncbi:MAG: amidohydrolase family protein [Rhabdochlamydiaceae bacterium]
MKVDFETHFYPKEYVRKLQDRNIPPRFVQDPQQGLILEYDTDIRIPRQKLLGKFTSVETRLLDMSRDGIDMQVLSVPLPGIDRLDPDSALSCCTIANDELSRICEAKPSKFCAFALLPVQSGYAAAQELRRAVKDLGFKGGYLHSNCAGKYLDSEEYLITLGEAERLGVPMFVHPTIPFNYRGMEKHRLASTFGLQADLSLSLLRFIFSSGLERFPNLKLIVSHLGSTLSFISHRIDDEFEFAKTPETMISRKPSEYIKRMYVDTVTIDPKPLEFAVEYFGSDHVAFGSDYPFWDTSAHVKAIEKSSLSREDKEQIYSKTAASLLRLN